MEVRIVSSEDYNEKLVKWWKDWRWSCPPNEDMLPIDTKMGIMISHEGVDICAGFLYITNSKIAWIEYIVSNFEVKNRVLRSDSITYLISVLSDIAKNSGFKYIYTSLKSQSLAKSYIECGFVEGSKGCTELFKTV